VLLSLLEASKALYQILSLLYCVGNQSCLLVSSNGPETTTWKQWNVINIAIKTDMPPSIKISNVGHLSDLLFSTLLYSSTTSV
jgi:hypothetical protein